MRDEGEEHWAGTASWPELSSGAANERDRRRVVGPSRPVARAGTRPSPLHFLAEPDEDRWPELPDDPTQQVVEEVTAFEAWETLRRLEEEDDS